MKKQSLITILLTVLMSMAGTKAFAHDIEVANSDGVTIYYVWTNNKTELAVSYRGSQYYTHSDRYTGNVVIPKSVQYNGNTYSVTSIGILAFFDCYSLTSVTIPNSVTSIGGSAFDGCSGLTSVTIPNSVTSIGESAFRNCSALTFVNVTVTDFSAFCNNKIINSIAEIGKPIQLIDSEGIEITEYIVPNDVTSIGDNAFSNCSGLTSVIIGNSVTSIGGSAFSGCSGLTSVTIGNSVTSIGGSAFSGCSGLTSLIIPNSVTSIGEYAFDRCSDLKSVIVGSGVTSIGYNAFPKYNLKKTIWLTNTPPSGYSYAAGDVNYVSNNQFIFDNRLKYQYQFLSSCFDVNGIRYVPISPSERICDAIDCVYDESATNTKIGPSVTFKGVTMMVKNIQPYLAYGNKYIETLEVENDGAISENAFNGCINMKSAKLGTKISALGQYAFSGCSSLEAIDIPEIIEELNEFTFSGCSSLTEIEIKPKMTAIKDYVFNSCTSLKKVIMTDSENVLKLGSNGYFTNSTGIPLFSDCPLDSVYIGRNIDYNTTNQYGYSPFYRNLSLRAVKISDNETEISENEFYGCTNLKRVVIGDGVTTIGNWAFSGCSSLKFFAFGSQVATIGQEAFSDCTGIVEVISKAKLPPTCGSQALDDINKWECKLYVPDGCTSIYQAADQWKEFFFLEEGYPNTDNMAIVRTKNTLIKSDGNLLTITGVGEGATINVYDIMGRVVGYAKVSAETTTIKTNLHSGEIGIVKIGDKTVKVKIK